MPDRRDRRRSLTLRSEEEPRLSVMNLAWADDAAAPASESARLATVVTDHYERRGRELWGLARRLGASDEEAADSVQEAHLRLWRELGRGTTIEDVDAWTFRVLYRLVMDHHRLGRRLQDIVGRLRPPTTETISSALDDRLSLWPIVDRLPTRERATLYLRYRSDLSFERIGAVMGIKPGAARAYSSRGVERLRQLLTEAEGSDG